MGVHENELSLCARYLLRVRFGVDSRWMADAVGICVVIFLCLLYPILRDVPLCGFDSRAKP
ncbi:hypothetical protein FA15DRAFT_671658 [Coprinopsis marcescibilis]|uniref:Uncharacterized protein n=1 Tax=Coprinopsis marcescibilis TaxID=230819 RepID=A0A5C3L2E1_COPMA|nr:hypothetical protein FA15DRAFT_671658 [Coprinopsis marcescibilis]